MFELIKNVVLTGVGLAVLTAEKAEELGRELAKAAQLSGEKGRELVDEVVARSAKAREELEQTVQRYVTESLRRMNVPTRDDIRSLDARVSELERRLGGPGNPSGSAVV